MDFFILNDDRDWRESLISSLVNAIVLTLVFHYVLFQRTHIYFKKHNYDQLMVLLEEQGAVLIKTRGEKQYYKLKNRRWPNNRIIIKKTAFYLYADMPEKLRDQFLQLRDEATTQ